MSENRQSRLPRRATHGPMQLDPAVCYRALKARDARFDGRFFTAVRSTGVYCRPVCPARTPRRESVRFVRSEDWSEEQQAWLSEYFDEQVVPVLTPLTFDPSRPFPRVLNKSLNFIVRLKGRDAYGRRRHRGMVQAPRSLPRIIQLPDHLSSPGCHDIVFLSSVIRVHVDQLFPGLTVEGCYQFRVTRNSNLYVDEEEVNDLVLALARDQLEAFEPLSLVLAKPRLQLLEGARAVCAHEAAILLQVTFDAFALDDLLQVGERRPTVFEDLLGKGAAEARAQCLERLELGLAREQASIAGARALTDRVAVHDQRGGIGTTELERR